MHCNQLKLIDLEGRLIAINLLKLIYLEGKSIDLLGHQNQGKSIDFDRNPFILKETHLLV